MTRRRGRALAGTLVLLGMLELPALPAGAQDFSAPRMVGDDEPDVRVKKKRKKGRAGDDEDPGSAGVQDDGATMELRGRRMREVTPDALQERDPDAPPTPPGARGPNGTSAAAAPTPSPDAGRAAPDAGTKPAVAPLVKMPEPTGAAATALSRAKESIRLNTSGYGELVNAFNARRLENVRDPAAGTRALLTVVALFRDVGGGAPGGGEVPEIALALVRESHQLMDRLESDRALALAESAVTLAPSLPSAHVAVARARYVRNPGEIGPIAKALVEGLEDDWTDLRNLVRMILGAGLAVAGALALLLLGVAGVLMMRRARLLAHDAGHLLPVGMRGLASWGLAASLAVIPLAAGAGPLVTAGWWILLCWSLLERGERVLGAGVILASGAIPLVLAATAPALTFHETPSAAAWSGAKDLGRADAAIPVLEAAAVRPEWLGTLGILHKRAGRLEKAREVLEQALRLAPKEAWLHNNLGCVYASMGEMERAQMEFDRATEASPEEALYLHNSGTMHHLMGRTGAARSAWEAAERANREAALAFRDRTAGQLPRAHNAVVLDAPPPVSALLVEGMQPTAASEAAADDLWARLSPRVPRTLWPVVVVALLVLLGARSAAQRRFSPSKACRRCGAPACRPCDGKDTDGVHCGPCYNAFLVRGAKVEAAMKIRKDVEIRRYRTRQAWMTRLFSLVWPGAGQVFGGMPLAGGVLALLFGVVVSAAALTGVLLPDPLAGAGVAALRVAPLLIPAAIAWLVGMILAFKAEP